MKAREPGTDNCTEGDANLRVTLPFLVNGHRAYVGEIDIEIQARRTER